MRLRVLAATVLLPLVSSAQRMPERWFSLNPLGSNNSEGSDGVSLMHSVSSWGGFGGYRITRDNEHAWLQQLGGYIELVRIGNNESLVFTSSIEFIANPHNDIRFNPRATFWEEGFLYTRSVGESAWQVGYYHRCKHDVDNLLLGKERSLIFGSLLGKYLLPFKIENDEGLAALRLDLYTIRQDDRIPQSFNEATPNWKRMLGSLGLNVHVREGGNATVGWYTTGWFSLTSFGTKENVIFRFDKIDKVTVNGGLAVGYAIRGNAHFRIGMTYEYLSDTGITPFPERSNLLSFGVTILDPNVMW
ncbi:MAG TPA: hypothetical protein VNN76_01325 [Bacteroidota bacterium]|nr:hypothetical protein [Bacteroidota bacterium]